MKNIVENYSAETALDNDEGVVAIEYVVVSGAVVIALGVLWTAFGTALAGKLDAIVKTIK
jgi:Flp pilus assembly pilin Flp